jgi:isopenicillin N synthase-like dioxygenase
MPVMIVPPPRHQTILHRLDARGLTWSGRFGDDYGQIHSRKANGMSDSTVPVIDLEPFRQGTPVGKAHVARALDQACLNTGFFSVVGHGIPESLTQDTRRLTADFFALPLDEKNRSIPAARAPRGYSPPGTRSLSYTKSVAAPPDLQESFAIGPLDPGTPPADANAIVAGFFARNIWPERPSGFEPTMTAYFRAMETLANMLMGIFATALGVNQNFFADKIDRHPSVLRLTYYPAQAEAPLPGQIRSGEHTDYGSLTILRGDDVPGGLQVQRRDGQWQDVHPVPGSFVCNIGDLMMRWTDDYWTSTPHRVVNPPREFAQQDRISLVFFHMPNHDAIIRGIERRGAGAAAAKYPPISCAEYFAARYLRSERQRLDADPAKDSAAVR